MFIFARNLFLLFLFARNYLHVFCMIKKDSIFMKIWEWTNSLFFRKFKCKPILVFCNDCQSFVILIKCRRYFIFYNFLISDFIIKNLIYLSYLLIDFNRLQFKLFLKLSSIFLSYSSIICIFYFSKLIIRNVPNWILVYTFNKFDHKYSIFNFELQYPCFYIVKLQIIIFWVIYRVSDAQNISKQTWIWMPLLFIWKKALKVKTFIQ